MVEFFSVFFTGLILWVNERQLVHAGGHNYPGYSVDYSGAYVVAFHGQGVGDGQIGGVAEVYFDNAGEGFPMVVGAHQTGERIVCFVGFAAVGTGQHEGPVAGEQNIVTPVTVQSN